MSLFQTIATQTDPYAEQGPEDLYAINQAAGQGPHKASPLPDGHPEPGAAPAGP